MPWWIFKSVVQGHLHKSKVFNKLGGASGLQKKITIGKMHYIWQFVGARIMDLCCSSFHLWDMYFVGLWKPCWLKQRGCGKAALKQGKGEMFPLLQVPELKALALHEQNSRLQEGGMWFCHLLPLHRSPLPQSKSLIYAVLRINFPGIRKDFWWEWETAKTKNSEHLLDPSCCPL